jgi:hypothetical protein
MDFNSKAWHTEALYKAPVPDTPEHELSQSVVYRICQLLGPIADDVSTLKDIVNVAIWDAQELIVNRIPLNRSLRLDKCSRQNEETSAQTLDRAELTRSPNVTSE